MKRNLVIVGALGLAAVVIAVVLSRRAVPQRGGDANANGPSESERPDPRVFALLGDELSRTRRLDGVAITRIGIEAGSIRLDLQPDQGEAFRLEIMKRDPAGPPGLAETNTLSIYEISKPGSPTPESHVRASQELAKRLAAEEARGVKAPALNSMRERKTASR